MKIKSNKEIVEEFFIQVYVHKNYEFVEQYFAVDYFDHSAAGARSPGDAINILKIVHAGFPEIKVKTTQLIEEVDTVVFHGWFSMVHGGLYDTYPATGIQLNSKRSKFLDLSRKKLLSPGDTGLCMKFIIKLKEIILTFNYHFFILTC